MQFRDIDYQSRGEKSLDILEKFPKMCFEEKIVAKCVSYIFSYKNILLKYTKKKQTNKQTKKQRNKNKTKKNRHMIQKK